jgi:hypothetical protein
LAEWLTLTAAAERLGWRVRKVESRARREDWQRRRSNRGPAMEYLVPAAVLAEVMQGSAERTDPAAEMAETSADPGVAELAELATELRHENVELRAELTEARTARARAEGELGAELRRNAELRADLTAALVKAEARADRLEAALAETRRPWLARVLEGLRRKG